MIEKLHKYTASTVLAIIIYVYVYVYIWGL